MKIFLKSLIVPSLMKKYRHMSVLVAILIFILQIYLLTIPYSVKLSTMGDEYFEEKGYLYPFYSMDGNDEAEVTKISEGKFNLKDGKMISDVNNEEIIISSFTYEYENELVTCYVIFDVKGKNTEQINKIAEDYPSKDQSEFSEETIKKISQLIHIDLKKDPTKDIETLYEEYAKLSTAEVEEKIKECNYFDLYGITNYNYTDYLLLFTETICVSQVPHQENNENSYGMATIYYKDGEKMDFREVKSASDIGKTYCSGVKSIFVSQDNNTYLIHTLFYVLLYPIVLVLIMWLCMRRGGNLKRFKEYYNVAAVASIIPLLITFVVSWFILGVIALYGMLFSLNVLLAFFMINGKKELID